MTYSPPPDDTKVQAIIDSITFGRRRLLSRTFGASHGRKLLALGQAPPAQTAYPLPSKTLNFAQTISDPSITSIQVSG